MTEKQQKMNSFMAMQKRENESIVKRLFDSPQTLSDHVPHVPAHGDERRKGNKASRQEDQGKSSKSVSSKVQRSHPLNSKFGG